MARIFAVLLLLAASVAHADVYKWKAPDGKIHYSDLPPSGRPEDHKLGLRGAAPQENPSAKSIAEQDADFKKRRIEADEKKAKEEKEMAELKEKERNCATAKGNLKLLEENVRVARYNEKGEKEFLEEKDRPQMIADAKKAVDSWCK
jgi:hypothetical protein